MRNKSQIKHSWTIVAVVAAAMSSVAAHADSFYSSESAWAAALAASPTTINFEGIAAPEGVVAYGEGPGTSVTVGGVSFGVGPQGSDNILFVLGDGVYGYPGSTVSVQSQSGDINYLLITLPSSVTALGFDFGGLYSDSATVTLSDGTVQTVLAPSSPDLTFFGVIAPGGVDSVDIALPNNLGVQVADFSYEAAAVSATPEPSSLLLLGTGLVALAGMARRRFGVTL